MTLPVVPSRMICQLLLPAGEAVKTLQTGRLLLPSVGELRIDQALACY
jgi:hypothetical protein